MVPAQQRQPHHPGTGHRPLSLLRRPQGGQSPYGDAGKRRWRSVDDRGRDDYSNALLIVGFIARFFMKMNFLSICGLLAGSMDPRTGLCRQFRGIRGPHRRLCHGLPPDYDHARNHRPNLDTNVPVNRHTINAKASCSATSAFAFNQRICCPGGLCSGRATPQPIMRHCTWRSPCNLPAGSRPHQRSASGLKGQPLANRSTRSGLVM